MKHLKNTTVQIAMLAMLFIGFILSSFFNKSYTPPMAHNVMNRTLNNPFMISDQRSAIVAYNVLMTNTATLVLGNSGQVLLQTKTGAGAWTTISTGQSSVGSGLVFSGSQTQSVFGVVMRGDSVRIINNNLTGTPSYGSPAGMEILIN